MRALALPVAVRTAGLMALAAAAWGIAATDDSPDADIGLGLALLGSLVLAVAAWGGADGLRSARQGRPDREGVLVWLLSAAAFGMLTSLVTGVGVAVTESGPVPVGPLLSASFTWAGFVAVPGAVAFGLVRSLAEGRSHPLGPVIRDPNG